MSTLRSIDFVVRGDHIPLDALLKATGCSASGGAAKAFVASGGVEVDGRTELRKTCKLRPGQVVSFTGVRIRLLPAGAETSGDTERTEGDGRPSGGDDVAAPDAPAR